jgi:UDP:flavonoid glycosyltransferase YjiC (YdhE family)
MALSAHSTDERPVYLGFGSMATSDPEGVVRTFVETVERLGRRGVISAGWARLHSRDLPDSVLPIGEVPHRWLFPRMAAVVHHGGAGTTAAAFRAGVPQVVVPHIADQPYWGRRVHELGVGPPPVRRKDLGVDGLVGALEVALRPEARSAAYALGERIRAEDGVGEAVRLLSAAPGWHRGLTLRDHGVTRLH